MAIKTPIQWDKVGIGIVIVLALLVMIKPLLQNYFPTLGSLQIAGFFTVIMIAILLYIVYSIISGGLGADKKTFVALIIALAIILFILFSGKLDILSFYQLPLQGIVGLP